MAIVMGSSPINPCYYKFDNFILSFVSFCKFAVATSKYIWRIPEWLAEDLLRKLLNCKKKVRKLWFIHIFLETIPSNNEVFRNLGLLVSSHNVKITYGGMLFFKLCNEANGAKLQITPQIFVLFIVKCLAVLFD